MTSPSNGQFINGDGTFNSEFDNVYDFLSNDINGQVIDLHEIWQKFRKEVKDFQHEYHTNGASSYDYKTNIKNLWAVLNGFRSNLNTLVEFTDD